MGRREVLASLYNSLRAAAAGRGSSTLLLGEPGIGKSRLLEEVDRLARRVPLAVRWGHCLPGPSSPHFLWRQVFAETQLPQPTAEEPAARPRTGVGTPEPDRRGPGAGESRGPDSSDSVLLELVERLGSACADGPQLLLLDDLQWADEGSLRALMLFVHKAPNLPLAIIGAARLRGSRTGEPSGGAWGTVHRMSNVRRLVLDPLGRRESEALAASELRSLGVDSPAADRLEEILRAAGGNPFYLLETVRGVGRAEPPAPPSGPRWSSTSTLFADERPASSSVVRESLGERFHALPPEEREILGIGAIIGREFEADTVAAAMGWGASRLERTLRNLAQGRWLVRADPARPHAQAFPHDLVRESILEELDPEVRRIRLPTVARWWRENRPDEPLLVARLLHDAGLAEEARTAAVAAIEAALLEGAYDALPTLLQWLAESPLRRGADDPLAARSYVRVLAELRRRADRTVMPRLTAEIGRAHPSPEQRLTAQLWLAESVLTGSVAVAKRLLTRFDWEVASLPRAGRRSIAPRLTYFRALVSSLSAAPTVSLRRIRQARRAVAGAEFPYERCRLDLAEASVLMDSGRLVPAAKLLRRARTLSRREGFDAYPIGAMIGQIDCQVAEARGNLHLLWGAYASLIDHCRDRGMPTLLASALVNAGRLSAERGEYDDSWRMLSEARRIGVALELPRLSGVAELGLGELLLRRGRAREAERRLVQAHRLLTEAGVPAFAWIASISIAVAAAEQGRIREAFRKLSVAEGQARGIPHQAALALGQYRCHELAGDFKAAGAAARFAVRSARAGGWPLERLEASAVMLRWVRRHGSRRALDHWTRVVASLARTCEVDPERADPFSVLPGEAVRGIESLLAPSPQTKGQRPFGDRILIHLLEQAGRVGGSGDLHPAPAALTQTGISVALDVPRARFARSLDRLVARGWAERSNRRVTPGARRKFVYLLTAEGAVEAQRIASTLDRSGSTGRWPEAETERGAPRRVFDGTAPRISR